MSDFNDNQAPLSPEELRDAIKQMIEQRIIIVFFGGDGRTLHFTPTDKATEIEEVRALDVDEFIIALSYEENQI